MQTRPWHAGCPRPHNCLTWTTDETRKWSVPQARPTLTTCRWRYVREKVHSAIRFTARPGVPENCTTRLFNRQHEVCSSSRHIWHTLRIEDGVHPWSWWKLSRTVRQSPCHWSGGCNARVGADLLSFNVIGDMALVVGAPLPVACPCKIFGAPGYEGDGDVLGSQGQASLLPVAVNQRHDPAIWGHRNSQWPACTHFVSQSPHWGLSVVWPSLSWAPKRKVQYCSESLMLPCDWMTSLSRFSRGVNCEIELYLVKKLFHTNILAQGSSASKSERPAWTVRHTGHV